ncbi:hypothetical protein AVEN_92819-1 [Araneus ventricosus]|uniref:Uncharacterized protein n=1 Tax=Araneus ventricosus TaxID=182803 RepID=A0A4Y2IUX5_ARAVE|nr:hypothetical protein AVEN_92819-1 [Araneus ventricosus]
MLVTIYYSWTITFSAIISRSFKDDGKIRVNTPPNLLKTFVSNRVSQIQQLTKDFQWKHIPSECNPADLISRGLDVKALAVNDLWWKGPDLENLTASTPDSLPVL